MTASNTPGPVRLLAVDDDPDILYWIRAVYDGEQLATASTAQEAREILLAGNVDLVMLDICLGDDNGIDLLEAIRTDPALSKVRDTPVLMLTGSDSGEDYERAWELGSTAYVRKPLEITALRKAVADALSG